MMLTAVILLCARTVRLFVIISTIGMTLKTIYITTLVLTEQAENGIDSAKFLGEETEVYILNLTCRLDSKNSL